MLGGDGARPVPIRTAHRVGYSLDAPVRSKDERGAPSRHWVVANRRRTSLHQGENIIGRGEASDVRVEGTTVSRRHARLIVKGNKTWLEDLGSKNGTSLNGVRVSAAQMLASGARISIGSAALVYYALDSALSTETDYAIGHNRKRLRNPSHSGKARTD